MGACGPIIPYFSDESPSSYLDLCAKGPDPATGTRTTCASAFCGEDGGGPERREC